MPVSGIGGEDSGLTPALNVESGNGDIKLPLVDLDRQGETHHDVLRLPESAPDAFPITGQGSLPQCAASDGPLCHAKLFHRRVHLDWGSNLAAFKITIAFTKLDRRDIASFQGDFYRWPEEQSVQGLRSKVFLLESPADAEDQANPLSYIESNEAVEGGPEMKVDGEARRLILIKITDEVLDQLNGSNGTKLLVVTFEFKREIHREVTGSGWNQVVTVVDWADLPMYCDQFTLRLNYPWTRRTFFGFRYGKKRSIPF